MCINTHCIWHRCVTDVTVRCVKHIVYTWSWEMFGEYTVTPSLKCNLLLKANDPLQIHKQMCHCFSIHSLLQCRDGKITIRRAPCLPRSIPLLDVMLTTSFSLPLFTSLCRIHSRCQPRMDVTVAVFCSPSALDNIHRYLCGRIIWHTVHKYFFIVSLFKFKSPPKLH